ncbi:hypothetical protein F4802DRAFT_588121 [Xylaria palmicola]|nr:hypothetical protein F4802DRAFT_588121 [Xylaria palmicola]
MAISSERLLHISAFCALITGTLNLQARYSLSTAFDRPIHFSVTTLFLTGLVFLGFAKFFGHQPPETRQRRFLRNWLWPGSRPSAFTYLVAAVIVRVLLNWIIVRSIQCSWDGLYGVLPFFVAACSHLYQRPAYHLGHSATDGDTWPRVPVARFAALALLWGVAVAGFSLLAERSTGVICPAGWCVERLAPLVQLAGVFLDAVILCQVARLRQANQDQASGVWHLLGSTLCASAGLLTFLAIWTGFDPIHSVANVFLTPLEIRDVAIDSIMATLTLVFGVCLLASFHPSLISLLVTATTVSVLILSNSFDSRTNIMWLDLRAFVIGLVVFIGFGILLHLCRTNLPLGMPLSRDNSLTLGRCCIGALLAFLLALFPAFIQTRDGFNVSPEPAMAVGRAESDGWLADAMKSTTLQSAVEEYRHRYGLQPPPNFDKWYEFAVSVNSSIIDSFDQINSDLLPFWAIPPAVLREKTTHLLEYPSLSMGGVLIREGHISISPHVRGTHRWMVDVVDEMAKPFSQWLPDMQLAFNLDDECRVTVPVTDMIPILDEAQAVRSRAQLKQDFFSFSQSQTPPWDQAFVDADESIWNKWPDSFRVWSKTPIFSKLIAPACPADAPVNQGRWWNRKAQCKYCSSTHMESGFVRNWTLSGEVCHQSDLAHLHGFLTSPSAMAASQTLLPVFSQSKVHGFADILYPSPWSFQEKAPYEEEKDIPWERKLNSAYWRGASSDGFAIRGSWQMFLRARFVHLASTVRSSIGRHVMLRFLRRRQPVPPADTSMKGLASNEQFTLNVSFVGSFSRCDERDCTAEHVTFYGSSSAEPPASLDFQESWQHRHLIDLDGAAFSGRFLPFVRSASLPYRAALFRTWWEERLHPWVHYVPLDLRLGDLLPALDYFGGAGAGKAQEMAEAGSQWAQKALRKEDMQVYMFRLLLEWGRLIDDRREDLGFSH